MRWLSKTHRALFRTFIMPQFSYFLLVWKSHSGQLNNQINGLHKLALRLAYSDRSSSFPEFFQKNKSVTTHEKNIQILLTKIFKVRNRLVLKSEMSLQI